MSEWNESAVVTVIIVSVMLLMLCCAGNRKNLKCHNLKHSTNSRIRRNSSKRRGHFSRESSCRTATFTLTPDERSFNTSSCQSSTRSIRPRDPLEEEISAMLSPFPPRPRMAQTQSHYNHSHQQVHQHPPPHWTFSGGRSFHGTTTSTSHPSEEEGPWSRSVSLPTKIRPQQKKQYPKSPPPSRKERITRVNFLQEESQCSDTDEETNIKGVIKETSSQHQFVPLESPLFATCVRKQINPQPAPVPVLTRHLSFKEHHDQPVTHAQFDQTSQFGRSKHLSFIKSNKSTKVRKNSLDISSQLPLYSRNNDTIFEEYSNCSSTNPRPIVPENTIGKGILIRRYEREQEARMREMEMYYQYYEGDETPITLSPSSLTTTYPDTTESSCDFERFNFVTVKKPYFFKDLEMEEHFV